VSRFESDAVSHSVAFFLPLSGPLPNAVEEARKSATNWQTFSDLTPESASQRKNAVLLPVYLFCAFSGSHLPRSRWSALSSIMMYSPSATLRGRVPDFFAAGWEEAKPRCAAVVELCGENVGGL
jgi:hypothetical protein